MMSLDEERDAWWSQWWASDYSWDGLANKILSSSDPHQRRSLQDYWRDQEANLIEGPDGRRWTKFHLPLKWPDGSATGKMALVGDRSFQQEVARRFDNPSPSVPLDGCVLPHFRLAEKNDVRIGASRCFFVEGPTFTKVTFAQSVDFSHSWFERGASFSNCQFLDSTRFIGAKFNGGGNFGECSFEKEVQFGNASFESSAWFGRARFKSHAYFGDCHFKENGAFNAAYFHEGAHFADTMFGLNAQFSDVHFLGNSSFYRCEFQRSDFNRARFAGQVSFDDSRWEKSATFGEADFGNASRIAFTSCNFEAVAYFDSVVWPRSARAFGGAFHDAVFARIARFTGPNFNAFALVSGATFKADFQLSLDDLADDAFLRSVTAAEVAAKEDFSNQKGDIPFARFLDNRLLELENAMRTLRFASESVKDHAGSQAFYRFELMCRQRQSFLPAVELLCLDLYEWCSDYGRSISRPLTCLLALWVVFVIVFWLWGITLDPSAAGVADSAAGAARLSVRSIVVPFSAWSERMAMTEWEQAFLSSHGASHGTFVRVVASLESLFSILLVFLSALAVRRRFQLA